MTQARGEEIASAARKYLGVPFRLHGREASIGLDCIGLAIRVLTEIGMNVASPPRYRIANRSDKLWVDHLQSANLRRLDDEAKHMVGDIWLVRPGVCRLHLLIGTETGFIHADGGLGCVVEMPAPCRWPIHSIWRIAGD